MKIYMTDIVPFGDEKIFAQMLPFITEDRKNKIMQLKKKEDRCRSLAAGLLLEYALREYGISLLPGKMPVYEELSREREHLRSIIRIEGE